MKQSPTHSPVRTLVDISKANVVIAGLALPFLDIGDGVECSLDTIVLYFARLQRRKEVLARVAKHIEGIFTCESDKLT
jgi:hypothetical protein